MSIMVSICCLTYNQEKYIAQAIEGFLQQKTNFAYEILIHDDASIDRTPAIIRDYSRQYPQIFRPIYQTENQYSQGININNRYNYPRARGKYIALCDGDDYWTDPRKLQKQVDYMEEHSDCSMCFHGVELVNCDRTPKGRSIRPYKQSRLAPAEDIIAGGGGLFGICSVVFPKQLMDNPPYFYAISPVNDAALALWLAIQGTVYYFEEVMAAYRQGVEGALSNRVAPLAKKKIHLTKMTKVRQAFNEYTEYKYADSIELRQIRSEANILMAEGNLQAIRGQRYLKIYKQLGRRHWAKLYWRKYYTYILKHWHWLNRKLFRK